MPSTCYLNIKAGDFITLGFNIDNDIMLVRGAFDQGWKVFRDILVLDILNGMPVVRVNEYEFLQRVHQDYIFKIRKHRASLPTKA